MVLKLDEYEKSVYLTKAQEDIAVELYNGKSGLAYEITEEVRRYLSNLNETENITVFTPIVGLSDTSVSCEFDKHIPGVPGKMRVLFITQEQAKITSDDLCLNDTWIDVIPVRRDEYNKIKKNPFKNKKVFRIDRDINIVELISKYTINTYKVSYLKKPNPIVLENFTSMLSIDETIAMSPCEMPEILHRKILERAVLYAYNYMATKFNNDNQKNKQIN